MQEIKLASSEADAVAAEAVKQHHAQLAGTLATLVEAVVLAASTGDADGAGAASGALSTWCERELVPHAQAEEASLYGAAHGRAEGRLLVDAMLAEHKRLIGLVRDLTRGHEPVRWAATASALQVLFETHLAKENDLVLPLLLAAPDVSVASLLAGMHELLGGTAPAAPEDGCGSSCGCGGAETAGVPELDARAIPHAIRHATVLGALDAVPSGGRLMLLAPHDPLPLLRQVEQHAPGVFTVDYLERGPEVWRLCFAR